MSPNPIHRLHQSLGLGTSTAVVTTPEPRHDTGVIQ